MGIKINQTAIEKILQALNSSNFFNKSKIENFDTSNLISNFQNIGNSLFSFFINFHPLVIFSLGLILFVWVKNYKISIGLSTLIGILLILPFLSEFEIAWRWLFIYISIFSLNLIWMLYEKLIKQ